MGKPFPANPVDPLTIGRLVIHLAHVVPSAEAIPHAGLEWRTIRRVWIEALSELGWTEDMARALALKSREQGFAEFLRDVEPGGSA